MKKILFPLIVKYKGLNKFWWNRLFLVAFVILILFTLFSVWLGLNNEEIDRRVICLSFNAQSEIKTDCDVFEVHSGFNFLLGLLSAIAINYLLQLLYYKVILYIFLGNKLKEYRQ